MWCIMQVKTREWFDEVQGNEIESDKVLSKEKKLKKILKRKILKFFCMKKKNELKVCL